MDPADFARDAPHERALFHLVPLGSKPWDILSHANNQRLVSKVCHRRTYVGPSQHSEYGFDIGTHLIRDSKPHILVTLGRDPRHCDIVLERGTVSGVHCQFEINLATRVIMLHDKSSSLSTQIFGENAAPFEFGRFPRRVMVAHDDHTVLGIGGKGYNLFRFRLIWYTRELQVNSVRKLLSDCMEIPELAPTAPSTRMSSSPTGGQLKIRWVKDKTLGRGAYGEVYAGFDVDTGARFAVKRVKDASANRVNLEREIEAMKKLHHPNILEYIAKQLPGDDSLEIFTELKTGNVAHLASEEAGALFVRYPDQLRPLLRDLLQAVDYLESQNVLHRDIKPANILYTYRPDRSLFYQLGDFGLCNVTAMAQTDVGTRLYMAPELFDPSIPQQTSKVDVWSIFVSLAWVANANDFRRKPIVEFRPRMAAVQEAIHHPFLKYCREMAVIKPEQRASACDMLDKLYGGNGRSTRRPDRSKKPFPIPSPQYGIGEDDEEDDDEAEDNEDEDEDGDSDVDRMSWTYTGLKTTARDQARTTGIVIPSSSRPIQPQKVSTRQLATAQNQPQRTAVAIPSSPRPQQPQRASAKQPAPPPTMPRRSARKSAYE